MKFLWVDIETTGLLPKEDKILELGMAVTDENLNFINMHQWVIYHNGDLTRFMDKNVLEMHTKSGLLSEVSDSKKSFDQVYDQACEFMNLLKDKEGILAGSSIAFDRGFLREQMPEIGYSPKLHYRMLDVSIFKVLKEAWNVNVNVPEGMKLHRVKQDIFDSVDYLKFWRNYLKL